MTDPAQVAVGPLQFSCPVPLDEIVNFLSRLTLWDPDLPVECPYVCTLDWNISAQGWAGSQDSLPTELSSYVTRVQKCSVGGMFYVGKPVIGDVIEGKEVDIALEGKFPFEVLQESGLSGENEVDLFTGLKVTVDEAQFRCGIEYLAAAKWLSLHLCSRILKYWYPNEKESGVEITRYLASEWKSDILVRM